MGADGKVFHVSLREVVFGSGTLWILAALLVLLAVFSILAPGTFTSTYNIRSLLTDASILIVLGVGMTFVIITSGIDLSVGSVLVFSGVVSVQAMSAFGGPEAGIGGIAVGFAVSIASGAAWGVVNGLLIAYCKMPPLIVTLGTFGASLGLAKVITNGVDDRNVPTKLSDSVGTGTVLGVPWLVVIALIVTVVGALTLGVTRFGRYTKAIGSNAEGARRVGVAVKTHLVKVYALAGILAGLGGFLSIARFSTTTIAGHTTDNLTVISAVVLGGTSLFGGVGSVIGTAIGVFIPSVLQNGFVILGIQPFWQEVAVGVVLILAVLFDQSAGGPGLVEHLDNEVARQSSPTPRHPHPQLDPHRHHSPSRAQGGFTHDTSARHRTPERLHVFAVEVHRVPRRGGMRSRPSNHAGTAGRSPEPGLSDRGDRRGARFLFGVRD